MYNKAAACCAAAVGTSHQPPEQLHTVSQEGEVTTTLATSNTCSSSSSHQRLTSSNQQRGFGWILWFRSIGRHEICVDPVISLTILWTPHSNGFIWLHSVSSAFVVTFIRYHELGFFWIGEFVGKNLIKMFGMLHFKLFFALALTIAVAAAPKEIYDPFFVFCGSKSCYEILEIRRNATNKQVRRAYRRLSLEYHPDKSKHANATEAFRLISKAYEVLDTNETRINFDYYLNHPRDYFKVSGHHYMRTLPKSDVRLVILLVACLISWMMHVMQEQKHERFMKHLKDAVLNCMGNAKSNNQTLALFKRCQVLYDEKRKEVTWAGSSTEKLNVGKMLKDPLFADCVNEVVATVKIEGGYRKPDMNDLFILRLLRLPLTLFNW